MKGLIQGAATPPCFSAQCEAIILPSLCFGLPEVLAEQARAMRDLLAGDNFGGRTPSWNCSGIQRDGESLRVFARMGAVIEASLPKPERITDAPPAPPSQS